jgi:hypothetical protein
MTEELTSPASVLVHAVEAPASDRRSETYEVAGWVIMASPS